MRKANIGSCYAGSNGVRNSRRGEDEESPKWTQMQPRQILEVRSHCPVLGFNASEHMFTWKESHLRGSGWDKMAS